MGRKADTRDYNSNMDHPDLNKCPDCECFFAGERCPLCGKLCPEEMGQADVNKSSKNGQ